jgi:hypothetical protein
VIPERLKQLTVFQPPKPGAVFKDPPEQNQNPLNGTTDNSNTQFAILALWAAQRHNIPLKRTLEHMVHRFNTSQNADGSWGYHYANGGGPGGNPAMTCVGLLGLAVGHGMAQERSNGPRVAKDDKILKGFAALSQKIGDPMPVLQPVAMNNLYFLWSVERVAVLFDLPTIGDKDWYRWGAQILLANQGALGQWQGGGYPGATPVLDTSLALLFLKRANLAKDLAAKLPFQPDVLAGMIAEQAKGPTPPPETKESESDQKKAEAQAPTAKGKLDGLVSPSQENTENQRPIPTLTPEPTPAPVSESGGGSRTLFLWLFLVIGLLLLLGGALLIWHHLRSGKQETRTTKPARQKSVLSKSAPRTRSDTDTPRPRRPAAKRPS